LAGRAAAFSVGLKIDNATVRIAAGLRLGAPVVQPHQWSIRGGTRGNAVPIVKMLQERMGTPKRMGTAFPL
jgi:hypothetical protein